MPKTVMSRRTVAKAAAWTVPVVTVAAAAPSAVASASADVDTLTLSNFWVDKTTIHDGDQVTFSITIDHSSSTNTPAPAGSQLTLASSCWVSYLGNDGNYVNGDAYLFADNPAVASSSGLPTTVSTTPFADYPGAFTYIAISSPIPVGTSTMTVTYTASFVGLPDGFAWTLPEAQSYGNTVAGIKNPTINTATAWYNEVFYEFGPSN